MIISFNELIIFYITRNGNQILIFSRKQYSMGTKSTTESILCSYQPSKLQIFCAVVIIQHTLARKTLESFFTEDISPCIEILDLIAVKIFFRGNN